MISNKKNADREARGTEMAAASHRRVGHGGVRLSSMHVRESVPAASSAPMIYTLIGTRLWDLFWADIRLAIEVYDAVAWITQMKAEMGGVEPRQTSGLLSLGACGLRMDLYSHATQRDEESPGVG